ncbi:MAG: 16S rRNA (cytosine(1402)-N(4))-methyltransferase RsmH [Victivallaceae bacterium]|nr:16S rRNA (cytosine(1402)-N(4))-methyltransferase RsmH [Victivallaceae bacterium]
MNAGLDNAGLPGSTEKYTHLPVLPREVAHYLSFGERPVRLIDGTVGSGGHSSLLLAANPKALLLGIDRDGEALERAARRLAFAGDRVKLVHGEFGDIAATAADNGFAGADGILLDIGVSSPQIDDPSRGFSWRNDGPLDMRMDASCGISAAELLNTCPEERLAAIFHDWGEIRSARKLAAAVVVRRKTAPFAGTVEFADFCESVLGRTPRGVLPLPTLVFQALRIAVNDELGQLERGLSGALKTLCPGGVMAVISFHSLEDRMVKNFMRDAARGCVCPPDFPVCRCGHRPEVELVTRKAVMAGEEELAANRRSAPARLRVARKTDFEKSN